MSSIVYISCKLERLTKMNPFDSKKRIDRLREIDYDSGGGINEQPFLRDFIDCNTIDVDLSTKLYRVMSLERLKQVISQKKLTLVRPAKWNDPYENFVLNATAHLAGGTKASLSGLRDLWYGQCWSLKEECDGLWRSFRSLGHNVKVKVEAGNLMGCFYDILNQFHSVSYFIGKVKYVPEKEIKNFFSKDFNLLAEGGQPMAFVIGLLTKRIQFAYEEEVRLLFKNPNNDAQDLSLVKNPWNNSDLFDFSIDPNTLLEEITIEPWVSPADYQQIRVDLAALGYHGPVNRSSLYDAPSFDLTII